MPEWIWVYDTDTDTESAIQTSQLPHGNYERLDESPLNENGDPRPARRRSEPEAPTGYEANTVADLKGEIDRRNADRDEADQLSSQGNKPDLIAALEADDNKES